MAGRLLDPEQILGRLDEALSRERRDGILFAVLTVVLTPVFLVVAVLVLIWACYYADLPVFNHDAYSESIATGVTVALIFIFATFFIRPKAQWQVRKSDLVWIVAGVLLLGLILLLTFATDLQDSSPGLYWILYAILALAMLGAVGHAYAPHDNYYLGWWMGRYGAIDDPFTLRDDVDRGHIALGFASAVPRLIFGSYGEIFGSTWLWRGLNEVEARRAARVLHRLGAGRHEEASTELHSGGKKSAARVMRALAVLKVVRPGEGHPVLSGAGEKLVGISEWY